MTTGGKNKQQSAEHILSLASILLPLLLSFAGLLMIGSHSSTSRYVTDEAFFITSVCWLILALWQFVRPSASRHIALLRLVAYHLFAVGYLILVTGLATPLTAIWIILMLASYIYYGAAGLRINLLAFGALVLIDVITARPALDSLLLCQLTLIASTLVTGLIAIAIIKSQQIDQAAFIKSQQQELLQRELTQTIVNNMSDAVLSTDRRGIIRVYNAAALSLLDTNASLIGKNIDSALKLTGQDGQKATFSELFSSSRGVTIRDDLLYRPAGGEALRLEITQSPIRSSYNKKSGQTDEGRIVILRDITKTKSLEEERDEFISVVSHELRTPIAIAEGTISNVQVMMERGDIPVTTLRPAVDTAHSQVMFLARMVNDLSTLSRAERGVSDEVEDIDVKELAYTMFNNYREQAESKGLRLDIDTRGKLGTVRVSRLYAEELLQNFITNAIKYTKKGSVNFSVRQSGGQVTFTVKDTGIGISKSDQKKIFEKFYRSEDYRTRETGGTGLGLYVSAKLARKLGTEIKLTSRLNHGSTFSFSLPIVEGSDENPKAA